MATPILTTIKGLFRTAIDTVAEIESILAFPFLQTKLEVLDFPAALLYLEPVDWEFRNRLERNVLNVNIELWYKVSDDIETLCNEGEELEALVHQAIFISIANKETGLGKYIQNIEKIPPDHNFPQDGYGLVKMQYKVDFLTTWGNPFSNTNY